MRLFQEKACLLLVGRFKLSSLIRVLNLLNLYGTRIRWCGIILAYPFFLTFSLFQGPNGSGKSSIFRVLRGLWPVVDGRLIIPNQQIDSESGCNLFYVPQRPYTCLGTLRDQIIYPLSSDEAEKRALHMTKDGKCTCSFY